MQQEILDTFETYAETYCGKDIEGLMAVFDDASNISIVGTGADELCADHAAAVACLNAILPKPRRAGLNGTGVR